MKNTQLYSKIRNLTTISDKDVDKLFNIASLRNMLKGSLLLSEGEVCNKIVFVEKGYLRVFSLKDGEEINTEFVFEGNFTTSLKSLRLSVPSVLSIQAGEASVVYEFGKDALLGLYIESAEIESFGRKLLEQLLMEQEEHANMYKLYSPKERYEYLLANRPEIIQRVSLSQIASYIGVARETLSRIRKEV